MKGPNAHPRLLWWQPGDIFRARDRRSTLRAAWLWSLVCAATILTGLVSAGWNAIPLRVGPVHFDLTFYPPLAICTLLTLWLGPWWGIVPAYLTSFVISLNSGMPFPTAAVFSLATPSALTVLWSSMVMLEVSPALRSGADVLHFAVLALISTGSSSVGALIWNYHHGLEFTKALGVWEGWVFGDFLQLLFIVGPLLYRFDSSARLRLASRIPAVPRRELQTRFYVAVSTIVLLIMICIGAAALRLFLISLDSALGAQSVSAGILRRDLREAAVFMGLYAVVFMASVFVISSTLGNRVEHHLRDIAERQRAQEEHEKLISELQGALSKVKQLSGLLPICASCKKIRDDRGYWNQIEHYLRIHSEAEFSHGLCPQCMETLYPEFKEN